MSSPLIPQGTLNRLRGSATFSDSPELNVTAPFLGEEGINLNPEGPITDNLGTMTGTVPSPAAYQLMTVEIELLKTQFLANLFKKRLETNSIVGAITVRTDASTLSVYSLLNCSIMAASPGQLNGKSVGFRVALQGTYVINSSLFSSI